MSIESESIHDESFEGSISSSDAMIWKAGDTRKINGEQTIKMNAEEVASTVPNNEAGEEKSQESPKSLFMRAYERVRNTDLIDNVSIWWKGRHIDVIESDIQRLEKMASAQNNEAGRHEQRLLSSDDASAKLAEMRQSLGMQDVAPSDAARRDEEYSAIKARAEAHRGAGEKIVRELAVKRELKQKFEQGREEARSRIAERVQNNIDTNSEAIKNVQNNIDEIQKNLGVAENIVTGLRAKQEQARAVADNPDVLSELKKSAQVIAQELEGRIQDMRSKMQLQSDRLAQYETRKAALETQKATWEVKIAKKPGPEQAIQEQLSDVEKAESFVAETTEQLHDQEDALLGNDASVSEVAVSEEGDAAEAKAPEQDPRVSMLKDLQEFMKDPVMQKYNDPDFHELVLEQGTPEQKALLKANGFFTNLFHFLESPATSVENSEVQDEKGKLDFSELAHEYDEILDAAEDDSSIAVLFDTENRKRIEQGGGTPQESLIVRLLNFFEFIFKNSGVRTEKKPDTNLL